MSPEDEDSTIIAVCRCKANIIARLDSAHHRSHFDYLSADFRGAKAAKFTGGLPAALPPDGKFGGPEAAGFFPIGFNNLGGGAIMEARGSADDAGAEGAGAGAVGRLIAIGGGAIGLAFSAGSSPGKTQTFLTSS